MAEEETQEVTTEETTEGATKTEATGPAPIPYDRFKEVNDGKKAAEARAEAAEKALKEKEDAEKSELEKAQSAAQEAKAQVDALKATIAQKERDALAISEAIAAGWNPEAVKFAPKLIEGEDDMALAVKNFADANPWVTKVSVGSVNAGEVSPEVKNQTLEQQIEQAVKDGNADLELELRMKAAQLIE